RIWLAGFQTLLTMLGLVSAALTIVLKDVLINLAGWVFIMLRKPFRVGSRVQIDRFSGDVVDIGLFQFALMEIKEQSTGRILHIPNGLVYVHTVATISDAFPFLWNEIPLTLTLDSDWEKARALLIQIVTREAESLQEQVHDCVMAATHEYMIHLGVTTPMVYLSVTADGVMLTMRYLCEPRNRRDSEMRMWEAVLRAFKGEENIHLRGTPSQVPVAPRLEPTVGVPEVSG
ncbi:MAG: mechanosensitive ion channel family protein, partial [Armatimonadetes bacterium]|nr:mechanosensitive ion channel family protein [Armatimonadota bacterium]